MLFSLGENFIRKTFKILVIFTIPNTVYVNQRYLLGCPMTANVNTSKNLIHKDKGG